MQCRPPFPGYGRRAWQERVAASGIDRRVAPPRDCARTATTRSCSTNWQAPTRATPSWGCKGTDQSPTNPASLARRPAAGVRRAGARLSPRPVRPSRAHDRVGDDRMTPRICRGRSRAAAASLGWRKAFVVGCWFQSVVRTRRRFDPAVTRAGATRERRPLVAAACVWLRGRSMVLGAPVQETRALARCTRGGRFSRR